MNRRAVLLGSLPLFIGGALMGAKAMRPKSDLELLADADMLLFPEDPVQGRGDRPSFADRGAWVMPFATFSVSAV
ncbi:MAG: hypothetical protein ABJN42_14465, partial [Roseibium sp.]|uniref:hypothetical protein n=1 Tax=Roseibium sp. TaxID=1936156 RepID=UPI003297424A